jgi:hypothetical protein
MRKDARVNNPLQRGERICLLTNDSKESAVAQWLFDRMNSTLHIETEQRPLTQAGDLTSFNKVFTPFDADDIVADFLDHIFSQRASTPQPLSLVSGLLDSEVKTFADLRKLPYKETPEHPLKSSFATLEKLYPGSTFGITKSKKQLE